MTAASRSVDSYSSPFSSVHRFLILTFGDTRSSGLPSFVPSFGTVFQRFPFSLFSNQKIIRRSFRTRTGLFFFYWLSMFLFCCFIFLCSEVLNVVGIVEVSVGLCFFLFFVFFFTEFSSELLWLVGRVHTLWTVRCWLLFSGLIEVAATSERTAAPGPLYPSCVLLLFLFFSFLFLSLPSFSCPLSQSDRFVVVVVRPLPSATGFHRLLTT